MRLSSKRHGVGPMKKEFEKKILGLKNDRKWEVARLYFEGQFDEK